MLSARRVRPRDERGAVTVLFALLLPLLMMFGSLVITVGSWYTHARQLQTKVDAAAFAGGGMWSFPCAPNADQRIEDTAREFFGEHTAVGDVDVPGVYNQQIGGVEGDQLYVTLNQANWWDDSFPGSDFTSPLGSVCQSLALDVKATENDSPLLWGWLPFLPDIKRKARVELEEPAGLNEDLLPIAVRVPKPVASAAVFFDETPGPNQGSILAVRYFEERDDLANFPEGLEGFSTRLVDTAPSIAALPGKTGVAIALSFRPACGTPGVSAPCFEDNGHATVNDLCNQTGSGGAIVTCYHGTGSGSSQNITTGLHFIRGYPGGDPGAGRPEVRGAWLENTNCESNGYFNSIFVGSCAAKLSVEIALGEVIENPLPNPPNNTENTRIANNIEVRYKLVREDGSEFCDYGNNCHLLLQSAPDQQGTATYSTTGVNNTSRHPQLDAAEGIHAIALQIRVRGSSVTPNPGNCGVTLQNFNDNCRWFYVGSGNVGPSTPPNDNTILGSPIQRAFMGDLDMSGPVKFLRVGKDLNCNRTIDLNTPEALDNDAGTHSTGTPSCWYVDMGLKGGLAKDQDEPPFVFDEGSGPSQMGFLECDPAFGQGQQLTDAIVAGCSPSYIGHKFDQTPLCPDPNQFFDLPHPAPWDDWEPIDCVKTRPTGGGNQLLDGLNLRIFKDKNNPQCPDEIPDPDNPGEFLFTAGRNYWHRANNENDNDSFAWDKDNTDPIDNLTNRIHPADPRLVTLFFTPYDTFSGSGQETFPVVTLGSFYITGYGRLNGNGQFQGDIEDPCDDGENFPDYPYTANEPPPDLNASGGPASGAVVWGHFLKTVAQSGSTSGGTGKACDPETFNPCVPVLVE